MYPDADFALTPLQPHYFFRSAAPAASAVYTMCQLRCSVPVLTCTYVRLLKESTVRVAM